MKPFVMIVLFSAIHIIYTTVQYTVLLLILLILLMSGFPEITGITSYFIDYYLRTTNWAHRIVMVTPVGIEPTPAP